jgi:hypothetical protein
MDELLQMLAGTRLPPRRLPDPTRFGGGFHAGHSGEWWHRQQQASVPIGVAPDPRFGQPAGIPIGLPPPGFGPQLNPAQQRRALRALPPPPFLG